MEDSRTIINIGRQFGSGGKQVAEAIGRKLGIKVYDSELISEAANESGLSPEFFRRKDEKRSFLTSGGIFDSNRFGKFTDNYMSDSKLFTIQCDTIRHIAEEGSAIFIGRASDYVLRDMACLDVFVCAPMEERIANVSGRLGISRDEAGTLIAKKDKGREAYYNFFTFGAWGVASNYDLCIDSSILGIEGTADYIIDFGRKAALVK